EGPGDRNAPTLSTRQFPHGPVQVILGDANSAQLFLRTTMPPHHEPHIRNSAQVHTQPVLLAHCRTPRTVHTPRNPSVGRLEPQEKASQRRLAGTVRPGHAKHVTWGERNGEAREHLALVKTLGHVLEGHDGAGDGGSHRFTPTASPPGTRRRARSTRRSHSTDNVTMTTVQANRSAELRNTFAMYICSPIEP